MWTNIGKEVRGPDSMKCMHMISRDRDHYEGRRLGVNGRLEPSRKFIRFGSRDPSLRLVWLLEPSSKCVLFWIFSIQLLKKHTPEPGNYSLLWQVDAKLITALLLLLITQLLIQIISYLIDNKIITLLLMLLITQLLVQALFDIFNIRYKIKTFSSFKIGKQICPGTVYKCD